MRWRLTWRCVAYYSIYAKRVRRGLLRWGGEGTETTTTTRTAQHVKGGETSKSGAAFRSLIMDGDGNEGRGLDEFNQESEWRGCGYPSGLLSIEGFAPTDGSVAMGSESQGSQRLHGSQPLHCTDRYGLRCVWRRLMSTVHRHQKHRNL